MPTPKSVQIGTNLIPAYPVIPPVPVIPPISIPERPVPSYAPAEEQGDQTSINERSGNAVGKVARWFVPKEAPPPTLATEANGDDLADLFEVPKDTDSDMNTKDLFEVNRDKDLLDTDENGTFDSVLDVSEADVMGESDEDADAEEAEDDNFAGDTSLDGWQGGGDRPVEPPVNRFRRTVKPFRINRRLPPPGTSMLGVNQ